MDVINNCKRKARKDHICDLCGDTIEKGSIYKYQFNKEGGDTWNFRAHDRCWHIAEELWEYIDPYDLMDEDNFKDGLNSFCREFICPDCMHYDKSDYDCCNLDHYFCIDKIEALLNDYYVKKEYNRNNPIFCKYYLIKR